MLEGVLPGLEMARGNEEKAQTIKAIGLRLSGHAPFDEVYGG